MSHPDPEIVPLPPRFITDETPLADRILSDGSIDCIPGPHYIQRWMVCAGTLDFMEEQFVCNCPPPGAAGIVRPCPVHDAGGCP